ncbi:hypothetical protein [Chitinophaga caseinilytica]|uniref:Uncharacterized protein n=1 Tax=Chitinophaga caseinilytica TaxID=2267521 RepID=A0ABZ2YY27_9BACT
MKKLFICLTVCTMAIWAGSCGVDSLPEPDRQQQDDDDEAPDWSGDIELSPIIYTGAPGIGIDTTEPYYRSVDTWPGVKLVRRPGHVFDPALTKLYGNTNTFYVDVHFVNTTQAPREHKLPAGTLFYSFRRNDAGKRYQTGMLTQDVTVTVPPTGPQKDTMTIYVGVVSINKNAPSPLSAKNANKNYPILLNAYDMIGWTDHNSLLEIGLYLDHFPKLKLTRHCTPTDLAKPIADRPEWMRAYGHIQEAVYQVTDGDGMSLEEMTELTKKLVPYMKDK